MNARRLDGRVAVITGGASGIGREIAETFAREGAAIVIADISPCGETVAKDIGRIGGRAVSVLADVTSAEAVAEVMAAATTSFGVVDTLVNNSFFSAGDDLVDLDEVQWDETMAGVVKSAYLCSKAVLPGMVGRGQGVIVNVASVNALQFLGYDAYSAGKAAMVSLTRSIAVRYGPHGVRANALAPGSIRTRPWSELSAADRSMLSELSAWYPLARVGTSVDVARAALFLVSDESAWITGIVLPVDGGLSAGNAELARLFEGGTGDEP